MIFGYHINYVKYTNNIPAQFFHSLLFYMNPQIIMYNYFGFYKPIHLSETLFVCHRKLDFCCIYLFIYLFIYFWVEGEGCRRIKLPFKQKKS